MGLEVSASTGALWPLTPQATPTLSAVTAGSGTTTVLSAASEFQGAWESLSSASGGTIDASSVSDIEAFLFSGNGGTAAVVVQGGSFKSLTMSGVQNLRFENMTAPTTSRAESLTYPFNYEIVLTGCNNIQFVNCNPLYDADDSIKQAYYEGTTSDTDPIPNGWVKCDSSCYNILFSGCKVEGYYAGIEMNDTNAVGVMEILNCEFIKTQMDDIRGGGWQNVRIEGCYFHDMYALDWIVPDERHKDCIQIWAVNSGNNADGITIKNNIFKAALAAGQTIFANVDAGKTIDNVLVENNLIYNRHLNGITFYAGVSNSTITRNTVLKNPDANTTQNFVNDNYDPRIWDRAGGNTVTDNICEVVTTGTGTVSSGNYFVTYGAGGTATDAVNHFVNPYEGADATLADLKMKTGSILFGSKGSTLL